MGKRIWFTNNFLIVVVFLIGFGAGLNFKNIKWQNPSVQPTPITSPSKDKIRSEADRQLEYFLRDNLSQFPKFQASVSSNLIKRVFPLSIKDAKLTQGWLIEVKKEDKNYTSPELFTYYLLTPNLEKELEDAVEDNEGRSCILNKVQEVDKVQRIPYKDVFNYEEKSGYLILSGSQCFGYDPQLGFVSVYDLPTGAKIKMQGDFPISKGFSILKKGVSSKGNAVGVLKGIYGSLNPALMVEYNGDVAYFDLSSGNLRQLIRFN